MNITIYGATGALGGECLSQALAAGHAITVLARSPDKLPADIRDKVNLVQGDVLNPADVAQTLASDTDAILFAIGVDKQSPENLCTDATKIIFDEMRSKGIQRFIWCGGASNLVDDDVVTAGARFVAVFAKLFMRLRHVDKKHQLEFLHQNLDIPWLGVRPAQMNEGPLKKNYRLGFNQFSGMSQISFADCAHAMLTMLEDDTWIGKAPIVQY